MIEAKSVIAVLKKHKKKNLENGLDAVLVSSQVVDIIVSLLEKQEPKKGIGSWTRMAWIGGYQRGAAPSAAAGMISCPSTLVRRP